MASRATNTNKALDPPLKDFPGANPGEAQRALDPLESYRQSLSSLRRESEALAASREVEAQLLAETGRLEAEREEALSEAAQAAQPDIDTLARLGARDEIQHRKLLRVGMQIAQAQAALANGCAETLCRFQTLQRAFWLWATQREKQRLASGMAPGVICPVVALEAVAACSKPVVLARSLEITANEAETLLVQAGRLLEAVSAEPDFVPPPFSQPVSAEAMVGQVEQVGLPWEDGKTDIQALVRQLLAEGFTMATVYVELKKRRPDLFKTQAQELSLGELLPAPETGVIEPPEPKWGRAPMIGDTVPG